MIKIKTPKTPPKPAINKVNTFIGILKKGSKLNKKRSMRPKIMCNRIYKAILPISSNNFRPNITKTTTIIPNVINSRSSMVCNRGWTLKR